MEANRPLTAEEEALKRNTDCIYFLASPFTCKKGNECEFRHSEGARVNPRDCWYWLNGNCLNPKCAFRHPPLDGLFGIPGTPGPLPSLQAVANAPGSYNPNKQSVPCYYFQKGQCVKGDRCAFMHGPHPASNHLADQSTNGSHLAGNNDPQQLSEAPHRAGNHVLKQAAKVSTSFTGTSQTVSWGLKECNSSQQMKPVEVLYSSAKSANKAEGHPVKDLPFKKSPSPFPLDYDASQFQPTVAPVSSDSAPSMLRHCQTQPAEEHYSNGRDADDLLGESSPGFDVLVDDEEDFGRDSEYYHNEDEYVRARQPNQSVNDFDYHHPDYEAVPSFEREQYKGQGQYDQDHHRAFSERAIDRISKRRPMQRVSSPDEMDGLDLRHRLSKKRRLGGLRSTVSHDRHGEPHRRDDRCVEDRYHGRSSRMPQESSFSSRLQGRITLPMRSLPERDRQRGRSHGKLSPPRTINHKGRLQDRIKRTPNEEFVADGRNFGVWPHRRDDGDPLNFAGPKSLAELKGAKVSGSSQEQPTKSINASEDSLSFEGPKPLSDILKRKRQSASVNDSVPSSGDESNEGNAEGLVDSASAMAVVSGVQFLPSAEAVKEGIQTVDEEEEGEGRMAVDAMEDQELENFDARDVDSDYEAIEGEDFKTEDGENAYQDDETAYQEDEDDEDDFAKKVGVFFP